MIAAGIDPGFGSTGLGIVDLTAQRRTVIFHMGITTNPKDTTFNRIREIRSKLMFHLKRFDVAVVTFEAQLRAAHGHHARGESNHNSAKALIGVGAAMAVVDELGLPVLELEPATIRKANGCKGNCSKVELARMGPAAYLHWPEKSNQHGRDALLIAGAGAAQWPVRERLDAARTSRSILQTAR